MTTNPKGWTSETTIAPWSGSPTTVEDVNDRVTHIGYDPLGRPTNVAPPEHPVTEHG